MRYRIALLAGVAVLAIGIGLFEYFGIGRQITTFTGLTARMMCAGVFVSGRTPEHVRAEELERKTSPGKYLALVDTDVDFAEKSVTGSLFGFGARIAIYRDGIGCTIAEGRTVAELRAQGAGVLSELPPADPDTQWPLGEATLIDNLPAGIGASALRAAVDFAFAEPDPEKPRRTRGVVVVYRGHIVAERYAPGFDKSTGNISNSVAKSFICTLIGILVGQGKLNVEESAPVAEWKQPGDPRGAITLDNLLRMSSGLEFDENYGSINSDVVRQFATGDPAHFAAEKPLEATPGSRWQYSTGTANILARIMRQAAGTTFSETFAFPRRALFDKLGMRNTVFQVDALGNFTGGGSVLASVRDYARLGLLYLDDGVWNGERLLPEFWVSYVRTPTAAAPLDSAYGAQFWLNTGTDPDVHHWPGLPADTFAMQGHDGQNVVIVPSRDAVIVRVGLAEFGNWKVEDFVARVLSALPSAGTTKVKG